MFTLANTVPNSMYILLAGGVLNTVLVPQIVRAIKSDADGGEAYTNRIMTAGLIVLGVITLLLTLAVPVIISLYSAGGWKDPALAAQYDSMIMLAYYCMPQVFFYGVYVLAGQVLNARDKFGPMMWAPIANNVVSIMRAAGLPGRLRPDRHRARLHPRPGAAARARAPRWASPSRRRCWCRSCGRPATGSGPRFDFRHTGLGKTFRLAKWTLGFVLVTQAGAGGGHQAGQRGHRRRPGRRADRLLLRVRGVDPAALADHRLAGHGHAARRAPGWPRAGDLAGVADETTRTIRLARHRAAAGGRRRSSCSGVPIAQLVFGFGPGAGDAEFVGGALMALAIGLVPFTMQYVCLRAFYALEDNRTTVLPAVPDRRRQRRPRRRRSCILLDSAVAGGHRPRRRRTRWRT